MAQSTKKEQILSCMKAFLINRKIDVIEHNAAFVCIQVDLMAVLWKEETVRKQLSIGIPYMMGNILLKIFSKRLKRMLCLDLLKETSSRICSTTLWR